MASDDDGYAPREPLTPLYNPSSGATGETQTPGQRGSRHGPLGARLSQRNKPTQPPAFNPESLFSPSTPSAPEANETQTLVSEYVPASAPSPTWGRVTGILKLDEKVTGALHADLQFGANWSSRSEMLRACLDEYYRLVASYNEARRLLELSGEDIEALRREQVAASMRLREVESRLEFHSRTELRAVYLGAAEIETRLFRAEEERDLLRSRAELLEGFMAFLSRIIATVRAIPPNVVIGAPAPEAGASAAANGAASVSPSVSPFVSSLPAHANPDETLLYNSRAQGASSTTPTMQSATGSDQDIEELVLDENEIALLASSEFEIVEILDEEPAATDESNAPRAASVTRELTGEPSGELASGDSRELDSQKAGDSDPETASPNH
jgi:hypothetical protein